MKKILLTQGKVALIDDRDFDRVQNFKWCLQRNQDRCYAVSGGRRQKRVYLHSLLLPGVGKVDHKDGDGLNNLRDNLRPASSLENNRNSKKQKGTSSRFKGVSWNPRNRSWKVSIRVEGLGVHLGYYEDENDAAHVYDYAAKIYFGEFARLNFPE